MLRPTASGWTGILPVGDVPEGVLGPLLVQELGDVVTVIESGPDTEVVVRGAPGTVRFRMGTEASDPASVPASDPTAIAARLQSRQRGARTASSWRGRWCAGRPSSR